MTHILGLSIVAEGVEMREQAARLRTLGCALDQGHLFSCPLSLGEPGEFVARGTDGARPVVRTNATHAHAVATAV